MNARNVTFDERIKEDQAILLPKNSEEHFIQEEETKQETDEGKQESDQEESVEIRDTKQ